MPSSLSSDASATLAEGPSTQVASRSALDKGKVVATTASYGTQPSLKAFTEEFTYLARDHPFLVPTGPDGILEAIQRLDRKLQEAGRPSILCPTKPSSWVGMPVNPGNIGLIDSGGLPELLIRPGLYPGFPMRMWITRSRKGVVSTNQTHIDWLGLCCLQVSQSQAAVVLDPQAKIFIVKNGGFAALAINGSYKVLAIVDQTHLKDAVYDKHTKAILGWREEVLAPSAAGRTFVVATFLSIPANNVAILQRGNELFQLGAGQHCITDSDVTYRNMFTTGECQIEMKCKEIYTKDSVPLSMTIFLRWTLDEPLKLTAHGYETPFDALQDKTHSILTQIVSHLEYSSLIRQRSLNSSMDDDGDAAATFLDALRTRAIDDLEVAANEYGIRVKDLAVVDRQFRGQVASTMDDLTKRSLLSQVEAANVDRENANLAKREEGQLRVAEIAAKTQRAQADGKAYQVIAQAKAAAEATEISARAEAEALKLRAAAESEAMRLRGEQDANIKDAFAREIAVRRVEVDRVKAFGNRTVFAPADLAGTMSSALAVGLTAGTGNRNTVG